MIVIWYLVIAIIVFIVGSIAQGYFGLVKLDHKWLKMFDFPGGLDITAMLCISILWFIVFPLIIFYVIWVGLVSIGIYLSKKKPVICRPQPTPIPKYPEPTPMPDYHDLYPDAYPHTEEEPERFPIPGIDYWGFWRK